MAEVEAGQTVREILRGPMNISGRMIQRLTRSRSVFLNRKPAFLDRRLRPGDLVSARVAAEEPATLPPVAMPLHVAYEDADLLIVDKPAGILVHPTSAMHDRTLAHGVAHHLMEQGVHARVRPVHRIDRDTSGLVLFAKRARAQAALEPALRDHTLRRRYVAVVAGRVPLDEGIVDAPIGPHPRQATLRAVSATGEPARTRYRCRERLPSATLLELELETGRTHQIRVHMAHLGNPVLGDRWYGKPPQGSLCRPALHAARLTFRHPFSGTEIDVEAPLPADIREMLQAFRGAA